MYSYPLTFKTKTGRGLLYKDTTQIADDLQIPQDNFKVSQAWLYGFVNRYELIPNKVIL